MWKNVGCKSFLGVTIHFWAPLKKVSININKNKKESFLMNQIVSVNLALEPFDLLTKNEEDIKGLYEEVQNWEWQHEQEQENEDNISYFIEEEDLILYVWRKEGKDDKVSVYVKHSAKNIKKAIKTALGRQSLTDLFGSEVGWTRDWGSNMIKALRDMALDGKVKDIGCFLHRISTILKDTFNKDKLGNKWKTDLGNMKLISKKVKASEKSDVLKKKINNFCDTRWMGLLQLISSIKESFDELRTTLTTIGKNEEEKVSNTNLVSFTKTVLSTVEQELKPFAQIITELQSQTQPKYHLILLSYQRLYKKMSAVSDDPFTQAIRRELLKGIKEKLSKCIDESTFIAAFFCPPHRNNAFDDIELDQKWDRDFIMELIRTELNDLEDLFIRYNKIEKNENEEEKNELDNCMEIVSDKDEDDDLFYEDIEAGNQNNERNFEVELNLYLANELLAKVDKGYVKAIIHNPMYWWDRVYVREQLPLLRHMALKYLIRMPGSHPAETLFSQSGNVLNLKRNKMGNIGSTTLVEGKSKKKVLEKLKYINEKDIF